MAVVFLAVVEFVLTIIAFFMQTEKARCRLNGKPKGWARHAHGRSLVADLGDEHEI